jgi:hypothetical protein
VHHSPCAPAAADLVLLLDGSSLHAACFSCLDYLHLHGSQVRHSHAHKAASDCDQQVKVIEGLGTTMDVVLVNGLLREGAQVVVCGLGAPIVTTIRSLLTPHPMKVHNQLVYTSPEQIACPSMRPA